MLTFSKFHKIYEATVDTTREQKIAVFTFGRFNPPTRGHGKLIEAVVANAAQEGGDAFIIPSKSHDKKKNPLIFQDKVRFMQALFPNVTILDEPSVRTPFEALTYFDEQGYTDVIFVVGSDRVPEFETRWLPYAKEGFSRAEVRSAGQRDPDASGISGMSGTKAREAAMTGDIAKFRVATGWSGEISDAMMNAVRVGLGIE